MKDSDKPKLALAIVLLVAAAVVVAWSFGVFTSSPKPEISPANSSAPTSGGRLAPGFNPGTK